jgi:hypothetical protein
MGKSTLALARCAMLGFKTILIFDPNDNYRSIAFDRVRPDGVDQWMTSIGDDDGYHVAKLGPFDQHEIESSFDTLVDALFPASASDHGGDGYWEDYALIVDEAMLLQKPSYINARLDRIWRRCPSTVLVIQTAHRFYEIHGISRYLVDGVTSFRIESLRDRNFADTQYFDGFGDIIAQLGDRTYVRFEREAGGKPVCTVNRDPGSWYIDLLNPNSRTNSDGHRG